MGHKPELPLLSPSAARNGSGNEADGNAKAEGQAQGKAKGEAKTKAKAKANPIAEVQGGEDVDASRMWDEPLVTGLRCDGPQEVCPKVRKWRALHKPMHKPW